MASLYPDVCTGLDALERQVACVLSIPDVCTGLDALEGWVALLVR
jgi:hypothetical protein